MVNCKNKNFGCAKTLTSDEKDDHENQCEFRMISCFERECKPMKNQLAITSFKEHYESNHWDRKEEIQVTISKLSYQGGIHLPLICSSFFNETWF